MLLVAGNDGRFVLHQFHEQTIGNGNLRVFQYNIAQIFNGYGGFLFLTIGEIDHQLLVSGAEVGGVAEEEGAFDHFEKY